VQPLLPGRVISFTGDDGLQCKLFVMCAWASDVSDDDNTDKELPNLLIMPATKAAERRQLQLVSSLLSGWCRFIVILYRPGDGAR